MLEEGKAKIVTDGVFYNPRMKFCRDVDMVVFSELKAKNYLDALAGSGVRGIRAMLEADYDNVVFNDKNPKACEVIRKNLEMNELKAEVLCRDAVALMRERKFDHIDLDPFGSPAEFIDAACFSAKRFLSVTATDTAALCGSAPVSGLRKYSTYAIKTEFYHEVGLRNLIGKIAREATKYEKSLEVLISWAKEHYYRVYVKFKSSPRLAGKLYEKIGFLYYCKNCLNRTWRNFYEEPEAVCSCGKKFVELGPLWLGELHSKEFVSNLKAEKSVEKLLGRIKEEMHSIGYYNIHAICFKLRVSPPPLSKIIEKLRDMGYEASKTRFEGANLKTNADVRVLKNVILSLQ